MTTVLVTGGAGFIGSQVTAELLRRGRAVRVIHLAALPSARRSIRIR